MATDWRKGVPVPGVWTKTYASGKTANVEYERGNRIVVMRPDFSVYFRSGKRQDTGAAMLEAERVAREIK